MDKPLQKTAFKRANMPVRVAAEALGMDRQTVRVMIQMGIVPWGRVLKLPGSRRHTYLISPKIFYEETGFLWDEADANIEKSSESTTPTKRKDFYL